MSKTRNVSAPRALARLPISRSAAIAAVALAVERPRPLGNQDRRHMCDLSRQYDFTHRTSSSSLPADQSGASHECDRHRTLRAVIGDDAVAAADFDRPDERAGEHDFARLPATGRARAGARRARRCRWRDGRARRRRGRSPRSRRSWRQIAPIHRRSASARREPSAAEHDAGVGGVVGDRVEHACASCPSRGRREKCACRGFRARA